MTCSQIPLTLLVACLAVFPVMAEEAFRTDASSDDSLPWFQLEPGKFPPRGSAHYFSGELIGIDHVNRTGTLRVDRTDAQRRSHWDLPVDFAVLPYGTIRYHGAPAALVDIPLGTHLHGQFYIKAPDDPGMRTIFHNRASIEAEFNRAFLLEDDFSYHSRNGQAWRIAAVDREAGKLTVLAVADPDQRESSSVDNAIAPKRDDDKPVRFDILPSTRIWKGREIGTLDDLAEGQVVQCNLTWATLFGPGRCTDIWLDSESREIATAHQLKVHRQYQRERGLAGWIDEVDNKKSIVTATLFGGVDPALLEDLEEGTTLIAIVAEPSLRSYDQVNDRKRGEVLSLAQVSAEPGSSGLQIRFQVELLLEGFRPGRIIRLFPAGWPLESIPQEERLFPERD